MQPSQVVSKKIRHQLSWSCLRNACNKEHIFLHISHKPTRLKRFTSPQLRSAVTETFTVLNIKANTNMYRNTMYIPTITSWLHSQWQSYIATKIALWVWPSQQFSSRCRTSNKNNTEYRTSVQKITLLHQNKENSEKKQTQKQFFFHSNRNRS